MTDAVDIPRALAAAWPPAQWCDVHVALAVSGGPDSMALLRAVHTHKQQYGGGGNVFALHVNHQLRGAESNDDAAWLERECERLQLSLEVLDGSLIGPDAHLGDGIEAAARERRYALLTDAAEVRGARYLATGHTADDQAETVLFRLLRGTGLRGLAGIPAQRPLSESVTLVRPLLGCRRAELLAFLAELGQAYRTDGTNADRRFARNRIRNELLPMMRDACDDDVDVALVRLADAARSASAVVEHHAEQRLRKADATISDTEISLTTTALAHVSTFVVCEVLRAAWRQANFPQQAMTQAWWEQLAQLARGEASDSTLNLPGNLRAQREGERLAIRT